MPHERSVEDVRPTQLYLSSEKLADVLAWFDSDDPNYGTLPAFEHEGEWYLSDGHTRTFVASLSGAQTLRLERDEEIREEYDFDAYLRAISWCKAEGIETVRDLHGRVVEPDTYQTVWIDRCHRVNSD